VNLSFAGTAGGSDYAGPRGQIVIAAGEVSGASLSQVSMTG